MIARFFSEIILREDSHYFTKNLNYEVANFMIQSKQASRVTIKVYFINIMR